MLKTELEGRAYGLFMQWLAVYAQKNGMPSDEATLPMFEAFAFQQKEIDRLRQEVRDVTRSARDAGYESRWIDRNRADGVPDGSY